MNKQTTKETIVMSQGKTSTIKEVAYNSRGYRSGLDYLLRNHPDNTHLLSCYEGISFRNLARCIMFDRSSKILKLDRYLERPRRFILVSTTGKIMGVMVTASMPEFYREIEYEDYAVIGAETDSSYNEFLGHLSFSGRAEIVTFNTKQDRMVRSRFRIRKTHCWSVFAYRDKKSASRPLEVRLMDSDDFEVARRLSDKLPEESSPFRSLKFQLKGLPYKNYALSSDDAVVFAGVYPYSDGVYQLSYLLGSTDCVPLLSAIDTMGKLVKATGHRLIWRLRKSEVLRNRTLIKRSGFVELAKESHLHLN